MITRGINNPVLIKPRRELPGSIGIIGAGTIGPDIAYYLKSELADLKLVLIDIDPQALEHAVKRIHGYADKGRDRGKLSPQQANKVKQNLETSVDYRALADCDWVLEAATENLNLKQEIFSKVETIINNNALITSNTSSLPAGKLFSHLKFPERTTVTHFFAPAFRNPAVEVITWSMADPSIIEYLRWFFCITGKVPMLTADVVCFMLDRIFDNWCNESAYLLANATPAEIDSVATEYVQAGPFFVLNLANGNPIIIETNTLQADEEGEHYRPAGIFRTTDKWDTVPPGKGVKVAPSTAAVIRDRLLGILFSQSVDILDRSIGTAADLDLGCRLAFAFKQGPLELMRRLGEEEVNRILKNFSKIKPGMPLPGKPLREYQNFQRFILIDEIDGVIIITLRRPEAMNALHDEMTDEILQQIEQFENKDIQGFVITGYGTRAFCSGADIGKFQTMLGDKQQSVEYARACSRLLIHIDLCKKPVVAALNGMAIGGGLELAIRCHGIVAVKDAWLQFPEITLGIVPGIGAMVVPYRRWPRASATFHNMLTRGTKLSVEAAYELGIIDTLAVSHTNLVSAAVGLTQELAGKGHKISDGPVDIEPVNTNHRQSFDGQTLSVEVLEILSDSIENAAAAKSLSDALEIGYQAFGESACTVAAKEGISAFQERRIPDFNKTG
ncbi:MAG: enoyl-CoA hydratase-related protein [Gammaproteobacteria bacterium]